jgi:hypothetical protein
MSQLDIINLLVERFPKKLSAREISISLKYNLEATYKCLRRLRVGREIDFEWDCDIKNGRPFRIYFKKGDDINGRDTHD